MVNVVKNTETTRTETHLIFPTAALLKIPESLTRIPGTLSRAVEFLE